MNHLLTGIMAALLSASLIGQACAAPKYTPKQQAARQKCRDTFDADNRWCQRNIPAGDDRENCLYDNINDYDICLNEASRASRAERAEEVGPLGTGPGLEQSTPTPRPIRPEVGTKAPLAQSTPAPTPQVTGTIAPLEKSNQATGGRSLRKKKDKPTPAPEKGAADARP